MSPQRPISLTGSFHNNSSKSVLLDTSIGIIFVVVSVPMINTEVNSMTGQINDTFNYKGTNYSISAIEYPKEFFEISALGLAPSSFSTACWRGYVAYFAIDDDRHLILKHLNTNKGSLEESAVPKINGKAPISKEDSFGSSLDYKDVDLPLPYSGGVLITDGFIHERYVHMGFQSPLSYELVIELKFKNGLFMGETDLSEMIKSQRENTVDITEEEKLRTLPRWIDEQFDLSYDKLYRPTSEKN